MSSGDDQCTQCVRAFTAPTREEALSRLSYGCSCRMGEYDAREEMVARNYPVVCSYARRSSTLNEAADSMPALLQKDFYGFKEATPYRYDIRMERDWVRVQASGFCWVVALGKLRAANEIRRPREETHDDRQQPP
jgi:hypothetical protein